MCCVILRIMKNVRHIVFYIVILLSHPMRLVREEKAVASERVICGYAPLTHPFQGDGGGVL